MAGGNRTREDEAVRRQQGLRQKQRKGPLSSQGVSTSFFKNIGDVSMAVLG